MDQDRPLAKDAKDAREAREAARDDAQKVRPTDPPFDADVKHPLGTAAGAVAGGAAAGAAIGSVAGPIGTAIGAAAATIAGAWAGRKIAEQVDPEEETEHWRGCYGDCAYVPPGATFDDYGPAYRYGVETFGRHGDRMFEHVEPDLATGWDEARGDSRLNWADARPAARDAWERMRERVNRTLPADDKGVR
jgi:hypothetical protein